MTLHVDIDVRWHHHVLRPIHLILKYNMSTPTENAFLFTFNTHLLFPRPQNTLIGPYLLPYKQNPLSLTRLIWHWSVTESLLSHLPENEPSTWILEYLLQISSSQCICKVAVLKWCERWNATYIQGRDPTYLSKSDFFIRIKSTGVEHLADENRLLSVSFSANNEPSPFNMVSTLGKNTVQSYPKRNMNKKQMLAHQRNLHASVCEPIVLFYIIREIIKRSNNKCSQYKCVHLTSFEFQPFLNL